jgi:hypothetical protein
MTQIYDDLPEQRDGYPTLGRSAGNGQRPEMPRNPASSRRARRRRPATAPDASPQVPGNTLQIPAG